MGHYERVRCDNCSGTGYKGDVWVEDKSDSDSSYGSSSSIKIFDIETY